MVYKSQLAALEINMAGWLDITTGTFTEVTVMTTFMAENVKSVFA